MVSLQLGNRRIGADEPPLVIAEVGINHDGDLVKALRLVDAVAEAGAECVKFQCHIVDAEMIRSDMRPGEISEEPLWDIIQRCELTASEEREIKSYCEAKGLLYLCTPFSREAADRLEQMEVAGFKIGSGECSNLPLLKHVARKGRPIILSTGMNDIASIRQSVEAIRKLECPFMLLHCTSAYPTPYEEVRLHAMEELRDEFNVPVGLSDHSIGVYTAMGAVALGAAVVEKHFTFSREWPGPDNPISIEPDELAELVTGARAIWLARGGSKTIRAIEQPVIRFAYASVVTIADIGAGDVLSLENVWVKRPGNGPIPAKDLDGVLGRTAIRPMQAGEQLAPQDFE